MHLTRPPKKACYEEEKLVARIIELTSQYGGYGYWRITAILQLEGW
jgi:putative transposase